MAEQQDKDYNVAVKVLGSKHEVGMFSSEPIRGKPCNEAFEGNRCGKTKSPHYCEPRAEDVFEFWDSLRLINPPHTGEPFELLPWMKQIVAKLFGVVVWDDGFGQWVRRYRHFYMIVGRGNSKSTLIAGIALYLLATAPPRSQMLCAAQTQDVTDIHIGGLIQDMCSMSPDCGVELTSSHKPPGLVRSSDSTALKTRIIYFPPSKPDFIRGFRAVATIMDEFATYMYVDDCVAQVLRTWGHYPEPLLIMASTPSKTAGSYERLTTERAKLTMKDPCQNPEMLPVVYAASKDDNLASPDTWRAVNPMLEAEVLDMKIFQSEWKAGNDDPIARNEFLRDRLGLPLELVSAFISPAVWQDNIGEKVGCRTMSEVREAMRGMRVWAGCDFSETNDLSSLGLLGVDEDGYIYLTSYSWIPDTAFAQLNKQLQGLPAQWIQEGHLRTFKSGEVGTAQVAKEMVTELAPYQVIQVGYDVALAQRAARILERAGHQIVKVPQGIQLHEAIGEFSGSARDRRIAHGGDPLLSYAIEGAEVKINEREKRALVKPKRNLSNWRIDPLVACVTAWQTKIEFDRGAGAGGVAVTMSSGLNLDDIDEGENYGWKPAYRL